ncbi:hypothetical protein [Rhodococcus jostii]|uniref:hypothetical protein n=1 Tax=Rhodococcus jostii TaxID=132919 RepID=UPI00362D7B2D
MTPSAELWWRDHDREDEVTEYDGGPHIMRAVTILDDYPGIEYIAWVQLGDDLTYRFVSCTSGAPRGGQITARDLKVARTESSVG